MQCGLSIVGVLHCRREARRGISLLEVLISMGVALVGLLSLAALVTLGRFEMLEGTKADRAMSVARSAQHEIKVRGFLRPQQVNPATGATVQMWQDANGTAVGFSAGTNVAFAIDPLGIATNGADATTFPAGYLDMSPNTFGSVSGALPMRRVTLLGSPVGPVMSLAAADSIFRSQDDLISGPPVGDFAPLQVFATAGGTPSRRQSAGDYSWLATVEPARNSDSLMARVSIVVFYKRNLLIPANPVNTSPPSERMVSLTQANGNTGVGGGDVLLSCPMSSVSGQLSPDYLKVRVGQWILLGQSSFSANNANTNNQIQVPAWFRWYKITAAGPTTQNGSNWNRNVTLAGPDWNVAPGAQIATFASLFDGVVGVYERDMELEESGSIWSPN